MSKNFQKVVEVMEKLRGENGCPWDKEQTRNSLKPFLLEETYEVLEAIEKEDVEGLKEELGDLLLQVVFHAKIAKELGEFDIEDVLAQLEDKLKRRHPHVFGDDAAGSSEEVLNKWESLKRKEKKNQNRKSALDGVPRELPALMRAHQLQGRAARVGFDWKHQEPVWNKVCEEMKELEYSIEKENQERVEAELGDLFFALVNMARFMKIDPEEALRKTNQRFYDRFYYMEKVARQKDRVLSSMSLSEMDLLWDEAKLAEKEKRGQEGGIP